MLTYHGRDRGATDAVHLAGWRCRKALSNPDGRVVNADCLAQVLLLDSIDSLQRRFFAYGPRTTRHETQDVEERDSSSTTAGSSNVPEQVLDCAANLKVPHQWFYHFYVLSVSASLFWALQLSMPSRLARTVLLHAAKPERPSMTTNQLVLAWVLMLVQGSRRLYECLVFGKRSASTMWVGHWAVGLLFYAAMSVAVWVEGAGTW